MSGPLRFGVVGHGWRADFYLRLARALPDRFACTGMVTRSAEVGAGLELAWGLPTHRAVAGLLAAGDPEVVVTSVPWEANPDVLRGLVDAGVAVLSETPPAPDVEGLRRLWADVGDRDLVQVAEQHPFLPVFTALRALVQRGALGRVTSAQVSWTHGYHATALLRDLLRVGGKPVRVTAVQTEHPLVEPPGRTGRPADPQEQPARHTVALLQTANGTGVYDFTDGQWFSPLRRRSLVVRGSRGEVVGDDVVWTGADGDPVRAPISRRQTGVDGNLEGADLDTLSWAGEVLYRNPYPGSRLSDEEIAIATCLERTGAWRRGEGPAPYPLADACQDHLLSLAIDAAATTGTAVVTGEEPWAERVRPGVPL